VNRGAGGLLAAGGFLAAAGVGAAGALIGASLLKTRVFQGVPGDAVPRNRWLAVTVNVPPELFPPASDLPEPIARLTDQAEVGIHPAPGGRGTELAMRLLKPPPAGSAGLTSRIRGTDPRQEIRSALRDAKSLIETGEVLQPDEPANHPTRTGKLMDLMTSRAGGEGRL
jgi:hypothetical protein